MSTGEQVLLGVALALAVGGLLLAIRGARRRPRSAPPRRDPSPEAVERVRQLATAGKKINAIKELRDATGWGLRESKDYVESLPAMPTGHPASLPGRTPAAEGVSPETLERVRQLAAESKKINAIKLLREETGWGLRESKDFVDGLGG